MDQSTPTSPFAELFAELYPMLFLYNIQNVNILNIFTKECGAKIIVFDKMTAMKKPFQNYYLLV